MIEGRDCKTFYINAYHNYTKSPKHLPHCLQILEWNNRRSLNIKNVTTATARSATYHDLHLEIDSKDWLRTKLNDRRIDLNFPIVNFPFIRRNIPAAPADGDYVSHLRACGSYHDFIDRGSLLSRNVLNQGLLVINMKSSLRKIYGRHRYGISDHVICSVCRNHNHVFS